METTQKPYFTTVDKLVNLKDHVGKEIGLTPWVTNTGADNNLPKRPKTNGSISTKPKAAYSSKKTVAHGFLVLPLALNFP